jgi:hypothetical protein
VEGVAGERKEPRLVELGFTDQQRALRQITVSQSQSQQFAPAEAGGIEQDQPKERIVATKGRAIPGSEVPSFRQKLGDFALSKDIGFDCLVGDGELGRVGDETPRFGPPPIQTEIAHDAHVGPSDTTGQAGASRDPSLESPRSQVLASRAEEGIEMSQDIAFHAVCPTQ